MGCIYVYGVGGWWTVCSKISFISKSLVVIKGFVSVFHMGLVLISDFPSYP